MSDLKGHDRSTGPSEESVRMRRRGGGLRVGAWLALILLMSLGGCQAGRPAREHGVQTLKINNVGGYLEFVSRHRTREQNSKLGAGKTKSKEAILEENIKLEFDGYAYHPNLLDFGLGVLFGLQQHEYEDNFGGRQRESSDEGPILEFDFTGQLFKKKSYPGSVYARRYRALEPRPFQPSLETTTTSYGLTWQYVSQKIPTNLQFSSTEVLLDPLSDFEEKGRHENTLLRFETTYRFTQRNALSLLYTHQSVEEEPFQLDYDSDELTLEHLLHFGKQSVNRLESELNYYDQRGTFSVERLRWREILRMEHSETLNSWFQFELLDRKQGSLTLAGVPPIEERSYSLTGTLEHKLYESLITQLVGYAQSQEFKSGLLIDRRGLQTNFDYRKKNRWGVLLASYRFRLQEEDHNGATQNVEAIDERHTFRDPEPFTLANTNANIGSIFMTAEDRTTVYRRGRDFTVERIGDQLELRRVPSGRILDGETVLVDYVFVIGGDFTLDTLNSDLSIRQNFDSGLTPYYRLRRQDQKISPPKASGAVANDITAHIVGTELRRGTIRFSAEWETHDSTINPFDAVRLSADYTRRFQSGGSGTLKARWTKTDHDPPVLRKTRFFTLEGRYRQPITKNLTVDGTVLYRNENDSLTGRDEGVDVDVTLEWRIRETAMSVTYEMGKFDDDFSENEFSALFVNVRRRF